MGTYRNGTYVAFDGQGEVNPVNSDLHNFELLKAWQTNDNVRFNFVNSHEKTYSVRDSSRLETLKAKLKERMANSKNMLVIVSSQTNKNRGLLNWEIQQAVEVYKLPIIVAYVDLQSLNSFSLNLYYNWLPSKLREYVNNNTAKVAHTPFTQFKIGGAINYYSVVTPTMPINSMEIY